MTNDIETLITALYVKIDDELSGPRWLGRPPALTDSELVCLATAQALLGFTSEAHWLRYAPQAPGWHVPLPAAAVRVQQAAAGRAGAGHTGHPDGGPVE